MNRATLYASIAAFAMYSFAPANANTLPEGTYIKIDPSQIYVVEDTTLPPEPPTCEEDPLGEACPCVPPEVGSGYPDCGVPPPIDPPPCELPVSVADPYGADYQGKNVLSNDIDATSARKASNPTSGTLLFNSDGTFEYTPNTGFTGADYFWYQAVNSCGSGKQVKVDLYVEGGEIPEEPTLCVPKDVGETHPECEVSYTPPFKPLGEYSVAGACSAVVDESVPQVTLQDREKLSDAFTRLKAAAPNSGGILNIPWNVDIIQCDQLWISNGGNVPGDLVVRGILGPNGEQPRMYCRSSDRSSVPGSKPWDGTIPYGEVVGEALHLNGKSNKTGAVYNITVENIHIDGYKKPITTWSQGGYVLRNNYIHHGLSDGISQSNNYDTNARLDIQICGNEIAYNGLDNVQHGSYIHRSVGGAGDNPELTGYYSFNKLTYVDNICHSSPFSHCLKSIANESHIEGNFFSGHISTDPTYSVRYNAISLIDVSMCANNKILNNVINPIKPEAAKYGDRVIGVRNRKTAVRGCDTPLMYTSEYDPIPPAPVDPMNVGIHTNEYWESLGGKKIFSTEIAGNHFDLAGEFAANYLVIWAAGTYPNYEIGLAAGACYLDTPDSWYERSFVYAHDNEYVGPEPIAVYYNEPPRDNFNGLCDPYRDGPVKGPGPSDDMIVVGDGEVYNWSRSR